MHKLFRVFLTTISLSGLISSFSYGQIGGQGTYKLLYSVNSARIAGLGGNFLAIKDNDITLALPNPSLITPEMNNNLALSYTNFAGISYGYAMYSRTFTKAGSFAGAIQFINYGTFTRADETGLITGTFSANDLALTIGWGRQLNTHFSIGGNAKLIYSGYDIYHSLGIAVDAAGTYTSSDNLFTACLLARNIGSQLIPYTTGNYEPIPFQLQAGASLGLKHIPLRFSFLYNHIERWDMTYFDPNSSENQKDPITGEVKTKTGISKFADNLMRHLVIGGELTIAKVLALRLGYNYEIRQELKPPDKAGIGGLSFGFGVHVSMFTLGYTRETYMTGPINPNYFTVAVNLNEFTKKKTAGN
ncbi:MAG: type IX secretion system protein PorQ [Bacteroidetes bacterium]|nr:type IX secretion system protein PorQ [Bacteroidota bacterium]